MCDQEHAGMWALITGSPMGGWNLGVVSVGILDGSFHFPFPFFFASGIHLEPSFQVFLFVDIEIHVS